MKRRFLAHYVLITAVMTLLLMSSFSTYRVASAYQDKCGDVVSVYRGGKYNCDKFLEVKARNLCSSNIVRQICIEKVGISGEKIYECGKVNIPARGVATYYACEATGKYFIGTYNDSISSSTQPMQIQLMAAPGAPGHIFFCISHSMNSGIKEECFGFYPRSYFFAFGGPGTVWDEFRKDPSRFSKVTISIKKPIDGQQRQQVMDMVKTWESKSYQFTEQNCIDFIDSIAQVLGWSTPDRKQLDRPFEYLEKLTILNK